MINSKSIDVFGGIRLVQVVLIDACQQLLDFRQPKYMSKNMVRMIVFGLRLSFIAEVRSQVCFCGCGIYEGAGVGDLCHGLC